MQLERVQEWMRYIKQNLTSDLSLEVLANYAHYSPYHFHRLFLLCTGEALMRYVRRLRLREASLELCSMLFELIEIAAKYKFESQDGFCRAFKSYYGLTPGTFDRILELSDQVRQFGGNREIFSCRVIEFMIYRTSARLDPATEDDSPPWLKPHCRVSSVVTGLLALPSFVIKARAFYMRKRIAYGRNE